MPPPGIALYFIAILPPMQIRNEIRLLKEYFRDTYQSKAALNSPPHITLHMPFQWKETKEEKLISALMKFVAGKSEVKVQLNGFSCFAPRVIYINVLESGPLRLLQSDLHRFCKTELNLFNAQYRDTPFHPHLTLAFRDLKKDRFERAWDEFKERKFTGDFIANKITLLKHDGKTWTPYSDLDF
ncbi:MAG: 2'-5' RNA ligase family protein [Cyclobacteriaceae bacterium]